MSRKMALVVIVYGLTLVALGGILRRIDPGIGTVAVIASVFGGLACASNGIAAWFREGKRYWTVLLLIPILLVLLSQTVQAWMPSTQASVTATGAWTLTGMLVFSVITLLYVLHGERTAEWYYSRPENMQQPGDGQEGRPHARAGHGTR